MYASGPRQRGTAPAPCRQRTLSTWNNLSAHNTERVSRRSNIWYVNRYGLGYMRAFWPWRWRMEADRRMWTSHYAFRSCTLCEKPNKTFACSGTSLVSLQRVWIFSFDSLQLCGAILANVSVITDLWPKYLSAWASLFFGEIRNVKTRIGTRYLLAFSSA